MTCREFVAFICEYLEGDLPAEQAAVFEQHLARCAACDRYFASYRRASDFARATLRDDDRVPEDVPEELIAAVMAAMRA